VLLKAWRRLVGFPLILGTEPAVRGIAEPVRIVENGHER
jgi:hypothetical protein